MNYTATDNTLQNSTAYRMGKIDFDPTSFIDQLFVPVKTGLIPLNSKKLELRMTVQDGLINDVNDGLNIHDSWGIN